MNLLGVRSIEKALKNKRHFEVVGLLVEGVPQKQISEKLKVSRQRVYQILSLYGLAPKARREFTLRWYFDLPRKKEVDFF